MMEAYGSDCSDGGDNETIEQKTLDFGRLGLTLDCLEEHLSHLHEISKLTDIETVLLNQNLIATLPSHTLNRFNNLRVLDLSSNGLTQLPQDLLQVCPLKKLILKNNLLTNSSLPKCFKSAKSSGLRELNLSGNLLQHFPDAVLELKNLKYLYLGANKIKTISKDIWRLQKLSVLSLGGNLLTEIPDTVGSLHQLQALTLCDNLIEVLPASIARLTNLTSLLIHKNRLRHLPRDIIALKNLVELSLRENPLVVRFVQEISLHPPTLLELSARVIRTSNVSFEPHEVPKTLREYLETAHHCVNPKCQCTHFEINLSGNLLRLFPNAVLELKNLKYLYLGANRIKTIPKDIWRLQRLRVLVLGGNLLTEIPDTVGDLPQLHALTLCDNLIEELPASIARLTNLEQLLIHKNRLRHLPPDIIALKNLNELSLRENPLIVRFVQEISIHPPSLLELAARVIRTQNVPFEPHDVPTSLREYLNTAHYCVNPKCRGVFFDSRVEHIKFADFCGRYRIPLLQYLCSPKCIESANRVYEPSAGSSSSDNEEMMRKVLLG